MHITLRGTCVLSSVGTEWLLVFLAAMGVPVGRRLLLTERTSPVVFLVGPVLTSEGGQILEGTHCRILMLDISLHQALVEIHQGEQVWVHPQEGTLWPTIEITARRQERDRIT